MCKIFRINKINECSSICNFLFIYYILKTNYGQTTHPNCVSIYLKDTISCNTFILPVTRYMLKVQKTSKHPGNKEPPVNGLSSYAFKNVPPIIFVFASVVRMTSLALTSAVSGCVINSAFSLIAAFFQRAEVFFRLFVFFFCLALLTVLRSFIPTPWNVVMTDSAVLLSCRVTLAALTPDEDWIPAVSCEEDRHLQEFE